tara:strand:+ start:177 stop:335 length:159 start_codon:yes stop_codon:yes gene_type:complete
MSLITIIASCGTGRRPVAAIHKHRDTGQELLIDVMDVMATIKLSLRPKATTY